MQNLFWYLAGLIGFNVLPIVASVTLRYERALISLDSIILLLLFAFRKRKLAWTFLAGLIISESLYGVRQQYPLFNLHTLLDVLPFIRYANPWVILAGCGVLIVFVGLCAFSGHVIARQYNRPALLGVLLLAGLSANVSALTNFDSTRPGQVHILNKAVYGSTAYELYYKWRADGSEWGAVDDGRNFYPLKTLNTPFYIWPKGVQAKKVLFLMVESWGQAANEKEFNLQTQALTQNNKLKVLKNGQIEYSGGTVAAELRDLCGISPISYRFSVIPEDYASNCLPRKLAEQGYSTVALHGAHAGMYSRNTWYPIAGFQKSYFLNSPLAEVSRCKSFPGFCDVDLIPHVIQELRNNKQIFFYWMTLNSHAPYDEHDLKNANNLICPQIGLKEGERCNQFRLIKEFFDTLGASITKPGLTGTEIVLVGDHKPPFFTGNFDQDFVKDKVPYIHLKIR